MNPIDPPVTGNDNAGSKNRTRVSNWIAGIAIVFSLLAPVIAAYAVIDLLVGMENLKKHYWIRDGIVMSVVLNAVLLSPLVFRRVRSFAYVYAPIIAVVIAVTSYSVYHYFMVAMMA